MKSSSLSSKRILASLSEEDAQAVTQVGEVVPLTLRTPIEIPHRHINWVYFPLSGLASVVLSRGNNSVEVGIVGFDGMTGHSLLFGISSTPLGCFVQSEGHALRVPALRLRELLTTHPALHEQALRYVFEFHLQLTETALANARGRIEERLARWLLMTQDRIGGPTLHLTHEFLSQMLGVRRPGVTTALQSLEEQRVIRSNRAKVTVIDRAGLIERSNGFYMGPPSQWRAAPVLENISSKNS
jgi:CRP-like cAMP-binding protein